MHLRRSLSPLNTALAHVKSLGIMLFAFCHGAWMSNLFDAKVTELFILVLGDGC